MEHLRDKIENLVEGILETQPEFWDNPNGGYQFTCPFCGNYKEVPGGVAIGMHDIKHDNDCVYLLAAEINKEL